MKYFLAGLVALLAHAATAAPPAPADLRQALRQVRSVPAKPEPRRQLSQEERSQLRKQLSEVDQPRKRRH